MKEAWSDSDKSLLRTRNHSARWRLVVHKPASVFRARIANTPTTWPASAINVDNAAGTISDALAGYTARLGTSDGGSGLGKIRIRRDGSGSTLQIAEAGCALLDIQEGHYVTVYKKIEPWTKHYRKANPDDPDNHNFIVDYDEVYTSQLEIYGPLVVMGPPIAEVIPGTGTLQASFVGASTQFLGGSFASASWSTPKGTIFNESSKLGTVDEPVVYQISEEILDGDYFTLQVTDASGASHRGYRPIWALNNASQAKRVEFGRIEGGIEDGGYEVELRAFSPAGVFDTEEFQDGAEIVIFEEASFGDTVSSIGGNYPFRSNVVFRGWIVEDTITLNPFHSEVTFRARTINGLLGNAAAYDTFLADYKDGTSGWTEASELTPDRAAWYMVRHRSNVGDIVDVNLGSNLSTCRITYQDLGKGFFWDQLRANYGEKGHLGYVAADMQSNLFAFEDVQITGGSDDIPMAYNIEKQDRRDAVMISHPVQNTISRAILMSVASNTNSDASNLLPVGAESPGSVIGYFGGETEHTKGLYVDQDTLIQWAGNWRAKMNNPHPQTLVPLAGNYRLDPVPLCRVTLPLAASDNARGISWYDENEALPSGASVSYFLPKRLGLEYNSRAGIVLSDVELEKVTHGIGGSSITFPSVSSVDTGDAPDPVDEPGGDDITGTGDGFGTVYAMTGDALGRTRDLSADSPSWVDIAPSISGLGTSDWLSYFILDPWAPTTVAYLVTRGGSVYKSTDMDAASPSWTEKLSASTINTNVSGSLPSEGIRMISGSINQQDWIAIAFRTDADAGYVGISSDGGDSWTFHQVASGNVQGFNGAFGVVPHIVNGSKRLYYLYVRGANPDTQYVYRSDDGGQTWSERSSLSSGDGTSSAPAALNVPYEGNESGNVIFTHEAIATDAFGTNGGILKSTDGGDTISEIFHTEHVDAGDIALRTAIQTYTQDSNIITIATSRSTKPIYQATDGVSFGQIGTCPNPSTETPQAFGGFPYDSQQFYILTDAGIYVTTDNTSAWTDKTGDWSFGFNFPGSFGGHGVIVPIWVDET